MTWAWPLWEGPAALPDGPGRFGAVRKHDVHTGIDLYTYPGMPVLAVEDGVVVAAPVPPPLGKGRSPRRRPRHLRRGEGLRAQVKEAPRAGAVDETGPEGDEEVRKYIKNGTHLLPIDRVQWADYSRIEDLVIVVGHDDVETTIKGIDALEAAMVLNPACLEGRRLRWARRAWMVHNLVGHPLMQVLALLGWPRLGLSVHDATVPRPRGSRRAAPEAS